MNNDWLKKRTFHWRDFQDAKVLAAKKQDAGLKISLGLPTLNVAETIGTILDVCLDLKNGCGLLDQVAVIDSKSTDETVAVALAAGADVYFDHEILSHMGPAKGKGEALWKSLSVLTGDIIVWIDSDITNIHPRFICGLIGPLLDNPDIGYVKAFYQRPLIGNDKRRQAGEGGRVTELCARPLLSMFWPELANLIQPLSGESAARRDVLESVPFFTDYAVEIGLLVRILRRHGLWSLAQVDLDERIHTNQPLQNLGRMAFVILQAVFRLLKEEGYATDRMPEPVRQYFTLIDGEHVPVEETVQISERPPLILLDPDQIDLRPEIV